MNEEWRAVKGYEGLYEVSNLGRVRSLSRRVKTRRSDTEDFFVKGRLINPKQRHGGYLGVQLWRDGNVRQICIHRLVAQAFVPNPLNLPQVNHKDENKLNNRPENLEWCTAKYNANYGTRNQRMIRKGADNRQSIKLAQYTLDGEFIRIFYGYGEARRAGYGSATIKKYIDGKFARAYGYHWEVVGRKGEE